MVTFRETLQIMRSVAFIGLGVFVLVSSMLELFFAPMLLLKYYIPSLTRHGLVESPLVTVFYLACITIQILNLTASLLLYGSIFVVGYVERWVSYDTMTLLSSALSISLLMHQGLTGQNVYSNIVERDIYIQTCSVGDVRCMRQTCHTTEVFNWHQEHQCCGWKSANDLVGIVERNNTDLLPRFCCPLNTTHLRGLQVCPLNSPRHFQQTCSKYKNTFFVLGSASFISHPCMLLYTCVKIILATSFMVAKNRGLLPQSEGVYSHKVPP